MATRMIIDTDCGIDDAVAILMACAHPAAEIVGITTVNGNVDRDCVTRNVCDLLAYTGAAEIPVYAGASRPLLQDSVPASEIHGPNGLGTVELPVSGKRAETEPAPSAVARILRRYPGATVVALGPLTNLALTFNLYPEAAAAIGRLVIMGGALGEGNVTKFAEFNFFADPEAAHLVLQSAAPITIVPWGVCVSSRMTRAELASAVGDEPKRGAVVQELQDWIFRFTERRFGEAYTALADPVAMGVALDAAVAARTHDGSLRIELGHNALRGASIPWSGAAPGMTIVDALDIERFASLLRSVFTS